MCDDRMTNMAHVALADWLGGRSDSLADCTAPRGSDHDAADNMTAMPIPGDEADGYTATYDAWNRLVKIVDDSTTDTVAEYEYDGLNRRTEETADGETRHVYYSDRWQRIEVRVDGTSGSDRERLYVWGQRYVDGAEKVSG